MLNEDMLQYVGVFLDEANEQIELLESAILELEHDATPDVLQEIFRAAHTLKGSSRAMGFTSMGELTHAMEDVFDRMRHGELTATQSVVDALFEGLDALKRQLAEVAATNDTHSDASAPTARLRAVLDAQAGHSDALGSAPAPAPFVHDELTASAAEAVAQAQQAGCSVYEMAVRIAQDCVMKSVRALLVLQSLEMVGSILGTTPNEEAIENEEFGDTFGIVVATTQPEDALRKAALAVTEIVDVRLRPHGSKQDPPAASVERQAEPAMAQAAEKPAAEVAAAPPPSSVASLPEAPAQGGEKRAGGAPTQSQTVRVDVARLDSLLNLVGELVIDQTRIAQLAGKIASETGGIAAVDTLHEAAAHFGRITGELQEEIMKARMLPIDHVFNRFPRMIRDLAQKLGKEIEFVVSGRETELDRSVIEVIGDPLIHLLRNSVDHGIEPGDEREAAGKPRKGTVWLRARHEENYIVIEIEDDGRGIDPHKVRNAAVDRGQLTAEAAARLSDKEALNLVFASGFSTAAQVTDVSGRGVGMDIVKNNLTRFGALIDLESAVGKGTKFTIKLPLTLAIIKGLLVSVPAGVYVLPLSAVVETLRVEGAAIHTINGREVIVQRGSTIPLVRLEDVFWGNGRGAAFHTSAAIVEEDSQYVVIIGIGERRFGLVVHSLLGEQEIVIKSLGKLVGDIRGISGATILGDGRIALIVDASGLLGIAMETREIACAA